MRVSGVLIALCLCFSSISAHLQASSLRDDSSIYPRETEGASSVTFDGKIYITGGVRREPACATCPPETETVSNKLRIFDIATKSFTSSLGAHMNNERAFHTSVLYKDTIVVFGGASGNQELEQYNITQDQWTVITPYDDGYAWTPTGERPSGRYGHGAAVVGDHLYLFGGFDAVSGNALNDLWTFDFLTKTWESWEVYGWSPNPRGGFSLNAGVVGGVDVLILFGGMDSTKYYNELWIFNTNTHSWKHITPLNGPSPRAFHSAVVFQSSQLVIFGGSSANEEVHGLLDYYNDVWTISVARPQSIRRWSAVKFQESNLLDFPAARDGHVTGAWTSVTGENFFLAFSGSGEQRQTLADIWQFELTIDPLDTGIDGTEITDPQFGPGNLNLNISSARLFRFNRFYGEFTRVSCFPGHFTSECILDCSANANCSGNGQCLFGGSCCCDQGFSGADCSVATCSEYKSFTPHELNIVLLPHAIETAIIKLADLSARLYYLQQTLSAVSHSQVNMSEFAVMTSTFSEYCLTTFIDPEIACFDEIVGCEEPCGDETACWVGDVCINGQCIGGAPVDCSHLANGSNKCVNAWCDQLSGECQVSTVTCDDEDPCTEDMCDPETGACSHHTLSECDDGSCCTYDYCDSSTGKPVCFHTSKCEDYNPCTIDNCCESCSFGTCSYSWQDGCFTSKGQSTDLDPEDPGAPRKNGDAIILSGTKVVGSIPRASIKANAYFWLQSTECQLIYDITYEKEDLGEGVYETGAFFYGVAGPLENAGVIHSLPLGPRKFGYWSYCAEGITVESLRAGKIYVEIYFSTGAIRAQVEFNL